jgi:hypothetical protein
MFKLIYVMFLGLVFGLPVISIPRTSEAVVAAAVLEGRLAFCAAKNGP